MSPLVERLQLQTRRHFFGRASTGLGTIALASLFNGSLDAAEGGPNRSGAGVDGFPNFAPKAKRVIYLFQSGAPSQMDLFDEKPVLPRLQGTELPDSIRMGQRLTGMTSRQDRFPVAASRFRFARHGQSGAAVSDLLPYTASVVDELCFIKSMHTEAINHDPAVTFFQTGAQLAGRPSIGAWISYGLGSETHELPAFVVMISQGSGNPNDQPLYDRLWGSGFLPTTYQGIKFRSQGDPVLYLSDPPGLSSAARRRMLDDLARLDTLNHRTFGDPEILTRIAQYEMAYRMQTSVPELTDLSGEPDSVFQLYGPDAPGPGPMPPTACWRGAWPSGACASSSSSTAAGTSTRTCPSRSPASAAIPTKPLRPWCAISNSAGCSRRRWSSGAASSAGPSIARAA